MSSKATKKYWDGFADYVCTDAKTANYLETGKVYRLRPMRGGWMETVEGDRFAAFRFKKVEQA